MANYQNLRDIITRSVYENGLNEITGDRMQQVLLAMVDELGAGYTFKGTALPSTDPGTPDYNVFYIAAPGTYPNFGGGFTVPAGCMGILEYNGSWSLYTVEVLPAQIGTNQIADSAITTDKLAALAVTTAKIVDSAITSDKIQDAAVTAAKLASNAVTTAKIADTAVTTAKVADAAITEAKLASALITKLLHTGYKLAGVATPSTNPGTPDQNVFYLAAPGSYTHFGTAFTINPGFIGVIRYNGSWSHESIQVGTADAVKYTEQTLTDAEKAQARINIGAANDAEVVKSVSQSLTDAQKEQARTNIGAASSEDVSKLQDVMIRVGIPDNYTADKSIGYIDDAVVINDNDPGYIISPQIPLEAGVTFKFYSGFTAQQSEYERCLIIYRADGTFKQQRKYYRADNYIVSYGGAAAGDYAVATFFLGNGHGTVQVTKVVNGQEVTIWEPVPASYQNYVDSEKVYLQEEEKTLDAEIADINESIGEVSTELDTLSQSMEPIIPLADAIYQKEIPANYLNNNRIWYDTEIHITPQEGYIVSDFIPVEPGKTYKWYSGFTTRHAASDSIPAQAIQYKADKTYLQARNAYNTGGSNFVETITVRNDVAYWRVTCQPGNNTYPVKVTEVIDGGEVTIWEPIPATYESFIKETKVINPQTGETLDVELARLQESGGTGKDGNRLFIGSLANITPKINGSDTASNLYVCMDSTIMIPYRGITLKFRLPDGIKAGIKCANSGSVPATSSGTYVVNDYIDLENGDSQPLALSDAMYRVYFYKADNSVLSVTEIQDYIDAGNLYITFDGSDVVNDNCETEKLVKSLLYKAKAGSENYITNYVPNIPVFAHISDIHGDAERLERCMQYCDYLGITACLVSGDQVNFNPSCGWKFVDDIAKKHSTPMYLCLGNHDSYGPATLADKNAQLEYCIEHNSVTHPTGVQYPTYYYKDFTAEQIRLIVLDQWYTYGSVYYGQEQMTWFVNTLASTPIGYSVVVMMHSPEAKPTIISGKEKFYQPENLGGTSYVSVNGRPVKDIIDAFVSRSTLSQTYTGSGDYSGTTLSVNADFTSVDSSIKFIAQVSGHEHQDLIGKAGATGNQIVLNITTGASIYGRGITNASWAEYGDLPRGGKGSVQDAFNLYAIDKDRGVIRIVRVGSKVASPIGNSDDFVVRDYMVLSYL